MNNRRQASSEESLERLSHRLTRPTPSVGFAFSFGVIFIVLSIALWCAGPVIAQGLSILVPYGFAIIFGLLGVLTLWSCLYQLNLRRLPAAVVELSGKSLRIGLNDRVTLVQPGTVTLEFLRVRLRCLEKLTTWHERASSGSDGQTESFSKTTEKILHEQTLIEVKDLVVPYGDTWKKTESFTIPDGSEPSIDGDPRSVEWQLELSGKGGALSHFVHVFEIQVDA